MTSEMSSDAEVCQIALGETTDRGHFSRRSIGLANPTSKPSATLALRWALWRRRGSQACRLARFASRRAHPVLAVSGMGCGLCGSSRSRMAFNAWI